MIDLLQIEQSFDSFKRPDLPSITLCKPSGEAIFSIERLIYETNLDLRFNEISEFSFTIPKIINYKDTVISAYEHIKTKKLIHIEKIGFFVIKEVLEKEEGSSPLLEVTCESIESELLYKRFFLTNETTPIQLYNKYTISTDSEGNYIYEDAITDRDGDGVDDRTAIFEDQLGVNPKYFRTALERVFEQCPDWSAGYIDKEIVWKKSDDGTYPWDVLDGLPSGNVYVPMEDTRTESLIHFDDAVGSSVYEDDRLTTIINGVATRSCWFPKGNAMIDTSDYKFGKSSLYVDGSLNSYVQNLSGGFWDIDNASLSSSWTVDFWMKMNGIQTNTSLMKAYVNGSTTKYWEISIDDQNLSFVLFEERERAVVKNRLVFESVVERLINFKVENWHHIAVVKTDTEFHLYLDGKHFAKDKMQFDMSGYNVCEIGRGFKGWIDEVRVSVNSRRWEDDFTPEINPYRGLPISNDDTLYKAFTNRSFNIEDSTVYDFLINDVQKSYNCFIIFDIENKKINAYSLNNPEIRKETDLFLSYDNLLLSSEFTEFTDEIATALYCYGGGNLSIYEVNPLGKKSIYDFTYFKTTEWMSQNLIDALNIWEAKIQRENISSGTDVIDASGNVIATPGKTKLADFYHFLKNYPDGVSEDTVPITYLIAMTYRRDEVKKFSDRIDKIQDSLKNEDLETIQSMSDLVAAQKKNYKKKNIDPLDAKNLSDYKKNMNFLLYGKIEMKTVDGKTLPVLPNINHDNPDYRLTYKVNEMKQEDVYKWEKYGSLKSDLVNNPTFIGIEDRVWALTKDNYHNYIEGLDIIDYIDRVSSIIDMLEGDLNLKAWNSSEDSGPLPSFYSDWKAADAERQAEIASQYENLYVVTGMGDAATGKRSMYNANIQWLKYGTINNSSGVPVKSVVPPKFRGTGGRKAQLKRDNLYGTDIFGPLNNIKKIIASIDYYVEKIRDSLVFINEELDFQNILDEAALTLYREERGLSFTPNFTNSQLVELSRFIMENTYQNENITINNKTTTAERISQARKLYNQAVETIERIREPRFEFTINMANFVAMQKFSSITNSLSLGSEVTIETNKGIIKAVLLEINMSYDDISSLDLTFSNKVRRVGKEYLYSELMGQVIKNSDRNKNLYFSVRQQSDDIKTINKTINSNVDLSSTSITSSSNFDSPDLEINQYGLIFKERQDGESTGFGMMIKPSGIFYTSDNYATTDVLIGAISDPEDTGSLTGTTDAELTGIVGSDAGIIDGTTNTLALSSFSYLGVNEELNEFAVDTTASDPVFIGYGLNAKALIGNIYTSDKLKIISDNGFSKMTIDDKGVKINNATLMIKKAGAGLLLDPEGGLKIGKFIGDDIIYPNLHGDMDGNLTLRATIYSEKGNIGGWDIKKEGIFSPEEIKDSSFMKYQGDFDETIFKIKDVLKINNDNTGIFTGNVLSSKIQGKILLENVSLENNTSDVNFITKNKFIVDADKGIYFNDKINVNGEEAVSGSFTVGTTTFRFVNGILVEVTTTP